MKELVGKIFRDENGIETIERVQKRRKLKWKTRINYFGNAAMLVMECPKCGNRIQNPNGNKDYFLNLINMYCTGKDTSKDYCGYCGNHNIVEE